MAFGFGAKPTNLQTPTATASEPQTKGTPLRDTLRMKLRELVERGDVGAMRLAIDHPEMLKEPDPEPAKTPDEIRREIKDFLLELRQDAIKADPNYFRKAFE